MFSSNFSAWVCVVVATGLLLGCGEDKPEEPIASGGSASGTGGNGAGSPAAGGMGGLALGGGGGSGGAKLDQYGCDLATQVSCHGECFSTVGEEKGGCRLLRKGGKIMQLVVDGDDLFYAGAQGLRVIRLGTLADEVVTSGPQYVESIVPAGDYVYVTTSASDSGTFGPGTVQRAPRAGGEAVHLVTGVTGPRNLAVVGETVFFSIGFGTLYSVPAAGGVDPVDTMVDAHSLIADGSDLVYAIAGFTNFPIMVAPAADFAAAVEIVPETFDPTLVAVQEGNVYWFDDEGNYQRAPKAGGAVEVVHAAVAGFGPWQRSGFDIFSSTTTAGKSVVLSMPLTGGEPTEVGAFSDSAEAATSNATHRFVAIGGAIFEIAR